MILEQTLSNIKKLFFKKRKQVFFKKQLCSGRSDKSSEKVFDLIEQVMIGNQKCWLTTLRDNEFSTVTLNSLVLEYKPPPSSHPHKNSVKASKSTNIISSLIIENSSIENIENPESMSLQPSLYANRSQELLEESLKHINNFDTFGANYLKPKHFSSSRNSQTSITPSPSLNFDLQTGSIVNSINPLAVLLEQEAQSQELNEQTNLQNVSIQSHNTSLQSIHNQSIKR